MVIIIITITPVLIRGETGETRAGGIMSSVGDYQNAANTHTLSPNEIQPRGLYHLVKYYAVYSKYNQEMEMRYFHLSLYLNSFYLIFIFIYRYL